MNLSSKRSKRSIFKDIAGRIDVAALLFALLALLCLFIGCRQEPALYPVDYGQYEGFLKQCGLTWTQKDLNRGELYFTRPLAEFDYAHFSWMKLLSPSSGYSTAYAAAVVRLFTKPFGMNFHTDHLLAVWCLVLCIAVYFISLSLRKLLTHGWGVLPAFLCLLFLDGNFIAVFRGLYPQGAMIAFGLLYSGFLLDAFARRKTGQKVRFLPLAISAGLFLTADTSMLLFLPFAVIEFICLLFSDMRKHVYRLHEFIPACLVMLAAVLNVVQFDTETDIYFSDAARYQSIFNVMLPEAEDPSMLLLELDLDSSYLPDVGKSYYEDPDSFSHPPMDDGEAEELFSRLTFDNLVFMYQTHPELLLRVIKAIPARFNAYVNPANLSLRTGENNIRFSRTSEGPLGFLRRLLPYRWTAFALCAAAAALLIVILSFRKQNRMALLLLPALAGAVLYLPGCVITGGYSSAAQYALFQIFMTDLMFASILMLLCSFLAHVSVWALRYSKAPVRENPVQCEGKDAVSADNGSLWEWLSGLYLQIAESRKKSTVFVVFIAAIMILITLLKPNHSGLVNNSDFDRMMRSIDLGWQRQWLEDPEGQVLHWVIEDYEWLEPFSWRKLTWLDPTFGLYWFVSLSRLITDFLAVHHMNTYVLEWLMGLIGFGCLSLLTYDLHPLLKKYTPVLVLLLCALFCSENSLTWYNGLYGEGSVMLGLLMSITCAVHLAVMPPRSGGRAWMWFVLLTVSLFIFTTSKSQMMLAVPFALLLMCVLGWYHRPEKGLLLPLYGVFVFALMGFAGYGAYRVFSLERNSESNVNMANMWQAYFYGIFMISDDPIGDMEELGIDTRMAPDIGKWVTNDSPDADYVYFPHSMAAKAAFTDHVNTGTIISWYLKHPGKLIYMLNHAARVSRELYTGFRVYKGQDYSDLEHLIQVDGLGLWQYWRGAIAPYTFWGYCIFYVILLGLLVYALFLRKGWLAAEWRMLCCVLLFVMGSGVLQYPLSVVGNGFADNQKQMFGFSLCHDILTIVLITAGIWWINTGFRFFSKKSRH